MEIQQVGKWDVAAFMTWYVMQIAAIFSHFYCRVHLSHSIYKNATSREKEIKWEKCLN